MWELLRYLYFTNQLSPFWRCWIDEGLVTALRQFQHKETTDSFSPRHARRLGKFLLRGKFPSLAFVELPDTERKRLAFQFSEQNAAEAVRASYYNFSTLAEWASQQMKACKPDILVHIWGPMMQRPTESPNRSQIILEIDWSRGFEDIQKGMVEAISAEWNKAHPTGRKARRESDDKYLKGLVVMRRRELRHLPWPDACSLDGYNHKPIYLTKRKDKHVGPIAARESIRQVKAWLKSLLAELEGDEERLRNTDQTEWLEEYESIEMEQSCQK